MILLIATLVIILGVSCPSPFPLPSYLNSSSLLCGHNLGSTYTIRCKSAKESMYFMGKQVANLTNVCSEKGKWIPVRSYEDVTCVPKDGTLGKLL